MPADPKKEFDRPAMIAMLGLQALASYAASGLVRPGEHMHQDLAVRLTMALNRDKWL